jgi:molybdopterin converting factor small subunit
MSPDDFWVQLLERHPAIEPLRPSIRLARDGEFLVPGARLQPGDEIALIPPVSGG